VEFTSVLLSVMFGAIGYLLITYVFQPIIRYRDLKAKIISDLIYFANIYDIESKVLGKKDPLAESYCERMVEIRRNAADLEAFNYFIPWICRKCMRLRKENPLEASFAMIVLSNVTEKEKIDQAKNSVEKHLRIKKIN
jgi:hypothetical protein